MQPSKDSSPRDSIVNSSENKERKRKLQDQGKKSGTSRASATPDSATASAHSSLPASKRLRIDPSAGNSERTADMSKGVGILAQPKVWINSPPPKPQMLGSYAIFKFNAQIIFKHFSSISAS